MFLNTVTQALVHKKLTYDSANLMYLPENLLHLIGTPVVL